MTATAAASWSRITLFADSKGRTARFRAASKGLILFPDSLRGQAPSDRLSFCLEAMGAEGRADFVSTAAEAPRLGYFQRACFADRDKTFPVCAIREYPEAFDGRDCRPSGGEEAAALPHVRAVSLTNYAEVARFVGLDPAA